MTIGTQLHRADLKERYDSVIIGSGMGGLTTAVCLAKAGQKVLVLERHYTAGGFTHTYRRKGYEWDVGLHYIGEVHRKGSSLRRMFDFVSDGKLQWAEMDHAYDRIFIGSESYDYIKGEAAFKERMSQYFPKEKAAIAAYVKLIKRVNWMASPFFLERALPLWLARPLFKKLTSPFLEYARQTTDTVLRSLTQNERLITVLTGQWGDYGLAPAQSSFAMHALVAKHYLDGASYPVGGSVSIAQTISDVLAAHGAQIVTNAEVSSILMEDSKAVGVELANGRRIHAKHIISAVGVINTFRHLMKDNSALARSYQARLQHITPSFAHVCLYIGLKSSHVDLGLKTSNLWLYPDDEHGPNVRRYMESPDLEFPVVYISFPSSKDPMWEKDNRGKSTVEIVVPAPYSWFQKWESSKWQKRGAEYDALKKEISDRLISILLEKVPQLAGKIHYTELSTPLSTLHFSNYQTGEIYGIDHTPERFEQRWLRTDTEVKNLYLTGQDIVTCGIGGALCAGFLTAIRILGPLPSLKLAALMRPTRKAKTA